MVASSICDSGELIIAFFPYALRKITSILYPAQSQVSRHYNVSLKFP